MDYDGTIESIEGKLFIRDCWQSHFTLPVQYRLSWPTGISATEYPELIGHTCKYWQGGLYRLEDGRLIALENRGETKPTAKYMEQRPIPKPTKKGKYEYHNGAWQKHF